ncbi:MAG: acylneuraminate cytidylyltransferase family protein [Actinomycetota bacterium]|nr:acylneuraminate cytidylyltransferase family protein [Actinomycetota bacterium]
MAAISGRVVGLVPARAGSRRIAGKNVRPLYGHPLLAYTIGAALDSGVFDAVIVSTDSPEIASLARHYGADVPFLRPADMAGDLSPDIEWVRFTVSRLLQEGLAFDAFSILRPTSPLRQAATIGRAWAEFAEDREADSLRAVEPCGQHPAKMWLLDGARMRPLLDDQGADPPWHSRPYQALAPVFVQNASLEMAWVRVLEETGTISGRVIRPFRCEGYEGFDLNDEADWWVLERLVADGVAKLPPVRVRSVKEEARNHA